MRAFLAICCFASLVCACAHPWWIAPDRTEWLSVAGNRIVDAAGNPWMGRGVNLPDTRSCKSCAFEADGVRVLPEVKRRIDHLVDHWGVNFIRLNLENYAPDDHEAHKLRQYGGVLDDPGYFAEVVEIVRYIGTKPGLYVLLSLWHEASFDAALAMPTDRTRETWEKLAGALASEPQVIFGIANEPRGRSEADDARIWEAMNTTVAAIRAIEARVGDRQHLIAVQGTRDYARRVDYYLARPITAGGGANIVYEVHVYNPASDFDELVTRPWRRVPLLIGEFGPVSRHDGPDMSGQDVAQLIDLAEKLQVPYAGWTFHMRCPPSLLEDTAPGYCGIDAELKPTPWGAYLQRRILDRR